VGKSGETNIEPGGGKRIRTSSRPAEREVPRGKNGSLESVVYFAGDRQFESVFLHRRVLSQR
jgi:hypothetical protein